MKHLVDLDEVALSDARATLGTVTIDDTVNTALRLASGQPGRAAQIATALAGLADAGLHDRDTGWRSVD